MNKKTETKAALKVLDPVAWGLPLAEIRLLGTRLYEFWERFADGFTTATRDTSEYALDVLSGLLRMENERNFTNVARTAGAPHAGRLCIMRLDRRFGLTLSAGCDSHRYPPFGACRFSRG